MASELDWADRYTENSDLNRRMPLFSRSDGDLVRDEAPSRAILPYLMRGRNESIVFHETICDLTKTIAWLRFYNQTHPDRRATLFHLFLWACGRIAHERPKMNRFVAGERIYQRRGVWLSFAAKRSLHRDAPLVPVKLGFQDYQEPFPDFVFRLTRMIRDARDSEDRVIDREARLAMQLPHPIRKAAISVYRLADRWNLLPGRMIQPDPMFTSIFVANLGSLGLDRTWHHLYEHGTCSLFAVLGPPRTESSEKGGKNHQREILAVRWSLDERIADAHYASISLTLVRRLLEDPARYAGVPAPNTNQVNSAHFEAGA